MCEVKSGIFIERGMKKSRSGAPCSGSKTLFDGEGYEEVTVWYPATEVRSNIFIERGVAKT